MESVLESSCDQRVVALMLFSNWAPDEGFFLLNIDSLMTFGVASGPIPWTAAIVRVSLALAFVKPIKLIPLIAVI